ncbi:MAG: regulatory protein RecX [Rikenellaceae bacterium]
MCAKIIKPRKPKSAEQALQSLMRECAKAEKSSGDARRLMARWEVPISDREEVLNALIGQRFIDDQRFAEAYTREKTNLSGWGVRKISMELSRKGISREIITEVIENLDTEAMAERLCDKLRRKMKTVKYKDNFDLRNKLVRYGASLGYDYGAVSEAISQVITIKEEEECFNF